jgi:hypothetical protein
MMKLRVLFLLLAALPALATDYAFSYSTTVSSAAAVDGRYSADQKCSAMIRVLTNYGAPVILT